MPTLVAVRPLTPAELPLVERALPTEDATAHARRLAEQQSGAAIYLVAWLGERPVGHTLLRWGGSGSAALLLRSEQAAAHPYIEALAVHPAYRSRSIGSQIVAVAERAAARRGFRQIGLAVTLENVRARALYERLGYRDAGFGDLPSHWSYVDRGGKRHVEIEICVYLVKDLSPATPLPVESTPHRERGAPSSGLPPFLERGPGARAVRPGGDGASPGTPAD